MKSYVFPGNIEERILRIAGEPFPYMRTALFSEIVKDSERMLLELIHCPGGRVIFYTASGTGAMDAVVTNYVSLKKKAFIIAGGSFGYRWKSLCEYYQVQNEVFEVPLLVILIMPSWKMLWLLRVQMCFYVNIMKPLPVNCLI